jgi:hypothetical protein
MNGTIASEGTDLAVRWEGAENDLVLMHSVLLDLLPLRRDTQISTGT